LVVMPNHIHAVLTSDERARHAVPLPGTHRPEGVSAPVSGSIPTVVRSFKAASSRQARMLLKRPGFTLWQRGYYERALRSDRGYCPNLKESIRDVETLSDSK